MVNKSFASHPKAKYWSDKNKLKPHQVALNSHKKYWFDGKQLIIELDGRQHFEQVSNWKSPFHNQIRDAYKERKARQHKIHVIRILQEDVWEDKNNWEKKLTKSFSYKKLL